ncbi:MAG TPA: YcxB family protein, partial [Sulfurovum sp.]|nr:YcxB family protein [Sulfurovum sp.]
MNITYTLTQNEYQESVYYHYKAGKRPLIISVFLGLATFFILVGTDFSNTREVITNILTVFFAISAYLLFVRMLTAYQAKRVYTKSPILSEEVTLKVSKKGIEYNKSANTELLRWENFRKWKQNEKYYLLYTNHYQFNVIPKRALSEEQI